MTLYIYMTLIQLEQLHARNNDSSEEIFPFMLLYDYYHHII